MAHLITTLGPKSMEDEPVILNGEHHPELTYGNFTAEIDMINQAYFEVMYDGDADGRVFTFPIPTYNITKDFNWDDPRYELLWKITGKYGVPNFSNFVNSDLDPDDVRSMCCRLRLDKKKLEHRGGGLFG